MAERWCKCGHPEYLHGEEGCCGNIFDASLVWVCPCPRFQLHEFAVASAEDLCNLRGMLQSLTGTRENSIVVLGEDGVRYTFCPKGIADGATFQEQIQPHFVATSWGAGTKSYVRHGFLWPIEHYVYSRERQRIIEEILSNLHRGVVIPRLKIHYAYDPKPYPEDFGLNGFEDQGADFIEDFRKAIERTNEQKLKSPKVKKKVKLRIEKLHGIWWLIHGSWMPLCFDTFEEAALFARRYIKK